MTGRHDPTVVTAVLVAAEAAINRGLELDPTSARDLADMAGTVLAIDCSSPEIEVLPLLRKRDACI